jgi:hypothetical protein
MMVEPPGNSGRRRVFEVDDGILVAAELLFVEERAGAVNQAVKLIRGFPIDALAVEARKESG